MEPKALSVSEVLAYVKNKFSQDYLLQNLCVAGEISSFRPHHSGHMYFVLKDDGSQIKCVMFRSKCMRLTFTPDNGMSVIVRGYFSLYERDGQIQLYAEEMQQEGIGSLHAAFEKLKEKLKSEGLFDSIYKKRLPFLPKKIGVVTSSSGAVINDIKTVLARRFPTEIVLAPAVVQGAEAAQSIVKALAALQKRSDIDVIIVARGGGSIEDLWPFNTEEVARAIFACSIPVISAVGHETDFTISDFVADVRAATPSQAAELAVPAKSDLTQNLLHLQSRLHGTMKKITELKRNQLLALANRPVFITPERMLVEKRQYLDFLLGKLVANLCLSYERKNAILKEYAARLDSLSPLKVLARGYVLCYDEKGTLIKSVKQTQKESALLVRVSDGSIDCTVNKVCEINGSEEKGK